jgi:uncharacterized RDD family membrane protein YckC
MTSGTDASSWQAEAPRPPVGPAPGLVYGGFWIRTLAFLVDALLLTGAAIGIASVTGIAFFTVTTREFHSATFNSVSVFASPTLAGFALWFVYFTGLWALAGQTVGMAPFGLRVVRAADGKALGLGRAIGRFFGLLLSFAIFLIGVIWVAADRNKQGWHDKLARTFVVRDVAATGPSPIAQVPGDQE